MKNPLPVIAKGLVCVGLILGCGDGANTSKLAPATGTVTYKGSPLAGANVTFMPNEGPLAMAVTDLKGEFKLNTGSLPGCTIGPVKVAVSVAAPGESSAPGTSLNPSPSTSPEGTADASKRMAEATQAYQAQTSQTKPKSLIPDRYRDGGTSGLSFTVDADGAKNNFKIELQD